MRLCPVTVVIGQGLPPAPQLPSLGHREQSRISPEPGSPWALQDQGPAILDRLSFSITQAMGGGGTRYLHGGCTVRGPGDPIPVVLVG